MEGDSLYFWTCYLDEHHVEKGYKSLVHEFMAGLADTFSEPDQVADDE